MLENLDFLNVRQYCAKLLLFGEFTIIDGGMALATTLNAFYGKWSQNSTDPRVIEYFQYLLQFPFLNQVKLKKAIASSIEFKSTIPIGYGLGSSGSITAACYDAFKLDDNMVQDKLLKVLASMESFFHGKSSGLDPMTIYLNQTISSDNGNIQTHKEVLDLSNLFLLNSFQTRDSKKMIEHFYKLKESSAEFRQALVSINILNRKAIAAMLSKDSDNLVSYFKDISLLQLKFFRPMIVPSILDVWEEGLQNDAYYLKLAGAGGGGFYLGLGQLPSGAIRI